MSKTKKDQEKLIKKTVVLTAPEWEKMRRMMQPGEKITEFMKRKIFKDK